MVDLVCAVLSSRTYAIVLPMIAAIAVSTLTIDLLEKKGSETTWDWTGDPENPRPETRNPKPEIESLPTNPATVPLDRNAEAWARTR